MSPLASLCGRVRLGSPLCNGGRQRHPPVRGRLGYRPRVEPFEPRRLLSTLITNGDFATGDLSGWTTFTDPQGELGPGFPKVVPFPDGSGALSAAFNVGRTGGPFVPVGGGICQGVDLSAGNYTLTAQIAATSPGNNSAAGLFELLFDGAVVDSRDLGPIDVNQTKTDTLSAGLSAVAAGSHEVCIHMARPYGSGGGTSTPTQYVAGVALCPLADATVIAQAGFNSPYYEADATVVGHGVGEPGWAGPWTGVGNETGARAIAQTAVVFEGDMAMRMGPPGPDRVQRVLATPQVGRFVVEQQVRFDAGAQFVARIENTEGAGGVIEEANIGAQWIAAPDGKISVLNGDGQGGGTVEDTGFRWQPGVWYKVDASLDVASNTWSLSVDDVAYDPGHPLGFRGTLPSLDGVQYLTEGSGNCYIDALQVTVPGPSAEGTGPRTAAVPSPARLDGGSQPPAAFENPVVIGPGPSEATPFGGPGSIAVNVLPGRRAARDHLAPLGGAWRSGD